MTRYVIDAGVAIRLANDEVEPPGEHELLAPTLLRSQTLSLLHEATSRGELTKATADQRLARIRALRLRLLGDRVLQNVAWQIADQLGWPSTFTAEYLALTKLQADAFVTLDVDLARAAQDVVKTAPVDVLYPAT